MGFREWILPQEKRFYDLLAAVSGVVVEGAEALHDLVRDFRDVRTKRTRLKEIEHRGDEAVHEVFEALNRTFITPIDREDIVALASNMDNVLDKTYASAVRMDLYEIGEVPPPVARLAEILRASCVHLDEGVRLVRDRRNYGRVEELSVEINRLENQADEVLNSAVAALFKERDAITIIKLKEIYEKLEEATDECEDVADALSDIAVKYR